MDREYLVDLHFIALMPSSCQNAEYAVSSVYYIMLAFYTVTCYKHCNAVTLQIFAQTANIRNDFISFMIIYLFLMQL